MDDFGVEPHLAVGVLIFIGDHVRRSKMVSEWIYITWCANEVIAINGEVVQHNIITDMGVLLGWNSLDAGFDRVTGMRGTPVFTVS